MQCIPESPLSSTLSSVPSAEDILSLYRSLSVGFLPEATDVIYNDGNALALQWRIFREIRPNVPMYMAR